MTTENDDRQVFQGWGKDRTPTTGMLEESGSLLRINHQNLVCQPEFRDPMTVVISFMQDPRPLRRTCSFMCLAWDHAVYLEGILPVPYLCWTASVSQRSRWALARGAVAEAGTKRVHTQLPEGDTSSNADDAALMMMIPCAVPLKCKPTVGLKGISQSCSLHFTRLPELKLLPEVRKKKPSFWESDVVEVEWPTNFCSSIHMLEVSHLAKLVKLTSAWLHHLNGLTHFTLSHLPALTRIQSECLRQCSRLQHITMEELPALTEIGNHFIEDCCSLQEFKLVNLPKLATIGDQFLYSNSRLKKVEISDLPSLKRIGESCLSYCVALQFATFNNLPKLETVEQNLLRGSRGALTPDRLTGGQLKCDGDERLRRVLQVGVDVITKDKNAAW